MPWTNPPLELRVGTEENPYTVAYIAHMDTTRERPGFFSYSTLNAAAKRAYELAESGIVCRIYDRNGDPVEEIN